MDSAQQQTEEARTLHLRPVRPPAGGIGGRRPLEHDQRALQLQLQPLPLAAPPAMDATARRGGDCGWPRLGEGPEEGCHALLLDQRLLRR